MAMLAIGRQHHPHQVAGRIRPEQRPHANARRVEIGELANAVEGHPAFALDAVERLGGRHDKGPARLRQKVLCLFVGDSALMF